MKKRKEIHFEYFRLTLSFPVLHYIDRKKKEKMVALAVIVKVFLKQKRALSCVFNWFPSCKDRI